LQMNPTIYYGAMDTFINSPGLNFPSNTTGFQARHALQSVMNFSFGIQQNIGFGTMVDVSYVGAQSRHLLQRTNLNSVPFGTDFLPSSIDPTTKKALSTNFLEPYAGYGTVTYYTWDTNANYNSLQASANRRFARGLQFGSAWTWSKTMDYLDNGVTTTSLLVNPRVWQYGKAGFDRTHIVRLSWTWDVPRGSRLRKNAFTTNLLDDWQLSGITTFQSGAPTGIGTPSFSSTTDITGSPTDSARVVVVQNPVLPKDQRTFNRYFNTNAFAPPAVGTFGNAPKDVFRGPGINNWDVSVFKRIRTGSERWRLQFRGEFYNAFNHTQFSSVYTTIRFDAQGNQIDPRLGQLTASRSPRRVQLALRLGF